MVLVGMVVEWHCAGDLNVRRGSKNTTLIPFDYFWHSFTFPSWDSGSKKKRNNSL